MVLVVGSVLTACAPMRRTPLPDPASQSALAAPGDSTENLACIEDPHIDAWEERLRSSPRLRTTIRQSLERAAPDLSRLRKVLAGSRLPTSLALLPSVESAFRPRAPVHANGRASARYLRALHARYRDWPLALAAYVAGDARIDRALARHPRATFWELAERRQLPGKSRDFVPRFLAVVRLTEDACNRRPLIEPAQRGAVSRLTAGVRLSVQGLGPTAGQGVGLRLRFAERSTLSLATNPASSQDAPELHVALAYHYTF